MSTSPNRCRVVQGLIRDVCLASSASCPTCRLMFRLKLFQGFPVPSVEQVSECRAAVATLIEKVGTLEVWRALQEAGPRPEQASLSRACMFACTLIRPAQQVALFRPQLADVQQQIGALRRQVQAQAPQVPLPRACLHEAFVLQCPNTFVCSQGPPFSRADLGSHLPT